MTCAACVALWIAGSSTTIWFVPCLVITGSDTPRPLTRFWMMLTESSMIDEVSCCPFSGLACSTTSRPPWMSSPSRSERCAGLPGTASNATPARAAITRAISVRCERREAKQSQVS